MLLFGFGKDIKSALVGFTTTQETGISLFWTQDSFLARNTEKGLQKRFVAELLR